MSQHGYELYADLSELRAVGQLDLPHLARDYSTMNHKVADTRQHDSAAFKYEKRGMDQVHGPWSSLRNRFQNILGHSSSNFDAAGNAIISIVDAYADTDSDAADDLKKAWSGGPPPSLSNPADQPLEGKTPPPIMADE